MGTTPPVGFSKSLRYVPLFSLPYFLLTTFSLALSSSLALMRSLRMSCDRAYVQLLQLLDEFLRAQQHAALVFRTQQEFLPRDVLESYLADPDQLVFLEQFSESVGLSLTELQLQYLEDHPKTEPTPRTHQPGRGGFSAHTYESIPPPPTVHDHPHEVPGYADLPLDLFAADDSSPDNVNTDVPPVQDPVAAFPPPPSPSLPDVSESARTATPIQTPVAPVPTTAPGVSQLFSPGPLLGPLSSTTVTTSMLQPAVPSGQGFSPFSVPPPPWHRPGPTLASTSAGLPRPRTPTSSSAVSSAAPTPLTPTPSGSAVLPAGLSTSPSTVVSPSSSSASAQRDPRQYWHHQQFRVKPRSAFRSTGSPTALSSIAQHPSDESSGS